MDGYSRSAGRVLTISAGGVCDTPECGVKLSQLLESRVAGVSSCTRMPSIELIGCFLPKIITSSLKNPREEILKPLSSLIIATDIDAIVLFQSVFGSKLGGESCHTMKGTAERGEDNMSGGICYIYIGANHILCMGARACRCRRRILVSAAKRVHSTLWNGATVYARRNLTNLQICLYSG